MGSTIRDGGGGTRYVEVQNSRWARLPISDLFGSGAWTTIRVGIRLDVTGTANFTPTEFFLGLCSGTSNIPGDATPTNAIGLRSNPAALWTYYTGGGAAYYQFLVGGMSAYKIVSGTETAGTNGGVIGINTTNNTNATGPMCCLFVTITKGSPNYTLTMFNLNNGYSVGNTKAQFDAQVIATTPTLTNYTNTGPLTVAFDESAGTLNAACLYWSDTNILRVHDWAAIRLA